MLMLYELEVLQSNCERIGDPVALPLTDIINSNANTNRSGLETTNDNQASTTSATNVIRQGSKVLPTLDDPKKSNSDNRLNSKGNSVIDKERMIDIDTLNPYMNKFVCSFSFQLKTSHILDGLSKLVLVIKVKFVHLQMRVVRENYLVVILLIKVVKFVLQDLMLNVINFIPCLKLVKYVLKHFLFFS